VQRILLDLSFAGVALHNLADRINFHSSLFSALVAFQDLFSDSDHSVGELLLLRVQIVAASKVPWSILLLVGP